MTSVEFNREKPMAGLGIQLSTGEKSEWLALVNSVGLSREFPMAGLGAQWSSIENPHMGCVGFVWSSLYKSTWAAQLMIPLSCDAAKLGHRFWPSKIEWPKRWRSNG